MKFPSSDDLRVRRGIGTVFFLILLVAACEERKRLNPMDPLNSNTRGRPTEVEIVSDQGTVDLNWHAVLNAGLRGYIVYRHTEGDSSFDNVAAVGPESSSYRDEGRPFDVVHDYCVAFVAEDYESPPSEPVSITPGPTYTWVADTYGGLIHRLTHDCRHVLMNSEYISYPWLIEVNPNRNSAWVVDAIFGEVAEVSAGGTIISYYDEFRDVSAIVFDATRNALWLTDFNEGIVYKLNAGGAVLFSRRGFNAPRSLAVDRISGNCYVADEGAGKIYRLTSTDSTVSALPLTFESPQFVSVDAVQRQLWVADGTRVTRFSIEDNIQLCHYDFIDACAIAVNENTGDCWVLDRGGRYDDGRIVLLSGDGTVQFTHQGLVGPRSLSVNAYDGGCIVAETGAQRLIRLRPDGEFEVLPIEVTYPYDVEVQN